MENTSIKFLGIILCILATKFQLKLILCVIMNNKSITYQKSEYKVYINLEGYLYIM